MSDDFEGDRGSFRTVCVGDAWSPVTATLSDFRRRTAGDSKLSLLRTLPMALMKSLSGDRRGLAFLVISAPSLRARRRRGFRFALGVAGSFSGGRCISGSSGASGSPRYSSTLGPSYHGVRTLRGREQNSTCMRVYRCTGGTMSAVAARRARAQRGEPNTRATSTTGGRAPAR